MQASIQHRCQTQPAKRQALIDDGDVSFEVPFVDHALYGQERSFCQGMRLRRPICRLTIGGQRAATAARDVLGHRVEILAIAEVPMSDERRIPDTVEIAWGRRPIRARACRRSECDDRNVVAAATDIERMKRLVEIADEMNKKFQ